MCRCFGGDIDDTWTLGPLWRRALTHLPKANQGMVFGARDLKYWVPRPSVLLRNLEPEHSASHAPLGLVSASFGEGGCSCSNFVASIASRHRLRPSGLHVNAEAVAAKEHLRALRFRNPHIPRRLSTE